MNSSQQLLPEQRLANYVSRRWNLSPPVDIQALASELAKVSFEFLPTEHVDGLTLNIGKSGKPCEVIINLHSSERRRRFTLAHEVGHILIPWHVGDFFCHAEYSDTFHSELYWAQEKEANRFASELLIPRAWLAKVIADSSDVAAALEAASICDVSAHAMTLALADAMAPGHVVATTDVRNKVQIVQRSPGTYARMPYVGMDITGGVYQAPNVECFEVSWEPWKIHVWRFHDHGVCPTVVHEDSRNIFNRMAERHNLNYSQRQSAAGVVGAANSMHGPDTEVELFMILRQKFAYKEGLGTLLSDPEFEKWLWAKSQEVIARREST